MRAEPEPDVDALTPTENTGRFLFDPLHDPSHVPDEDALARWTDELAAREGGALALTIASAAKVEMARPVGARRLLDSLPGMARRRGERVARRYRGIAGRAVLALRPVMREFAVDLTRHRLSALLEAIPALAVMEDANAGHRDALDRAEAAGMPGLGDMRRMLDEMDTTARTDGYLAEIRFTLEMEALVNLTRCEPLMRDRDRRAAAFASAREEVGSEELRLAVDSAVRDLGRNGR